MEVIMLPRVLDTRKGDDVRRTYRIVNCKKYRIKSQYGNKLMLSLVLVFTPMKAKDVKVLGYG
jgi:hypothetical protein